MTKVYYSKTKVIKLIAKHYGVEGMGCLLKWSTVSLEKAFNHNFCDLIFPETNFWLSRFVLEVRKKYGDPYPSNTLYVACSDICEKMSELTFSCLMKTVFDTLYSEVKLLMAQESMSISGKHRGTGKLIVGNGVAWL